MEKLYRVRTQDILNYLDARNHTSNTRISSKVAAGLIRLSQSVGETAPWLTTKQITDVMKWKTSAKNSEYWAEELLDVVFPTAVTQHPCDFQNTQPANKKSQNHGSWMAALMMVLAAVTAVAMIGLSIMGGR